MASLQERAGSFRLIFRFRGKQYFVAIGKVSPQEAEAKAAQVDYLLLRLKQGLIELPPGADIVEFLIRDGKAPAGQRMLPRREAPTLAELRDRYLDTHAASLEERTLDTARLHFKHLVATLGAAFPVHELTLAELQRHVDRRAKVATRHGKTIVEATLRKEIVTLRAAWNWGAKMGLVAGPYPNDGLRYPKGEEKPPFRTVEEIRRQLAAGGLTPAGVKDQWESLYLRVPEVSALLAAVKAGASHPWVHPLACMAAHTGSRRSELIRMQVADLDMEGGIITIREKKRVKGRRSTRRAPLTPSLRAALESWLEVHPGGNALFCHGEVVLRDSRALHGWS